MRILLLTLTFFISQIIQAKHLDLDKLLAEVKKNQGISAKINQARESKFLAEKNQQHYKLQTALLKLAKQQHLSSQLKIHLDNNEKELTKLETTLKNRSGILSELFFVAKQAAGDLKADLKNSLISAQFPERIKKLTAIVDDPALPTIRQLETLWYTLQHEMTESGKVVRFNTHIEQADGTHGVAKVVRVGTFNAVADGEYLQFSSDTLRLTRLIRQPESKYLSLAKQMATAKTAPILFGVDSTRGAILNLLTRVPDNIERIQQGGFIGYLILCLGATGFVLALYRLLNLILIGNKMNFQISSTTTRLDNPLGRVFATAEQGQAEATNNLELILDEAITREIPFLEKGLSIIKLLATVAPLLGLLGTVTGMIATFQSMSLFGTGDPKLMAGGISQALVTTMLGLCVAIPLLFLHNLLASRSRLLIQILDEQTAGLMLGRLKN